MAMRPTTTGLAAALLFTLACADAPPEETAGERVALLTSGPVSDAGWHAGAYEGLLRIRDSLGLSVSHQQTRTPAEFDEAFLAYAEDGYGLIFGHGFEYQESASRAAAQYPEVTFVISSGSRPSANVIPLIFRLEEASYLAGLAAGSLTQSGVVGMVGGVAIPSARGTFVAFEAGVHAVREDASVLETFIGSWDDVAAAKEATVAQLRQGADVLIHNTDAAGFGFFQAVREAREDGRRAWAFGMNRDQNDVAPDVIVGSAVIRIPEIFFETAKRWRDGALPAVVLYSGLSAGAVEFVPNPHQDSLLTPEIQERIARARAQIIDGTLDVPRIQFVEGDTASS